MKIVVLIDGESKEELLAGTTADLENIVWIKDESELQQYQQANAIIDLLYESSHQSLLEGLLPALIIINSVETTLEEINPSFVRINGWNTFLQSSLVEAAAIDEKNKTKAEEVFSLFNKKMEWVKDEVGFITPRVISMIINEAFIALKEGVSTKEEIDTAMKLGTNYPYGPFEWSEKIGIDKIKSLLDKLNRDNRK